MEAGIKLSIVFLNFNRINETQTTAGHLQRLCKDRKDIEIIAVDNGSTDGTADYLQQQPGLTSVLLEDNGGIAGYNQGFKQAKGQFILVLDDDSCPDSLDGIDLSLDYLLNSPTVGIIACRILSPDRTPQWSWHLPAENQLGPSPFFIGCGFIIRTEVFKQIGWYPAHFFLYQNEIDVSFKVALLGYEIIYDPNCIITHRGSPNQRPGWRRVFFPTRNTLWLIRQYYPQPLASYMIVSRIFIGFARAVQFAVLSHFIKALWYGLTEPVKKTPLPKNLSHRFAPFLEQNSLAHQLVHFFKS